MTISASLVKELRERTGVGMMECKRALEEANGDLNAAIELLRVKGQATAAKKAGRTAVEGSILLRMSDNLQRTVMLEINTETDFVARDDNFKQFADAVVDCALAAKVESVDSLINLPLYATESTTVEEARKALVAKIGENIQIRRLIAMETTKGILGTYIHGQRIGVIVELVDTDDQELAKDIAMHIAASRPLVVSPEDVPANLLAKEKEIYQAQALESGKPAEVVNKMVEGRVHKFLNEISLTGQSFVKEPDITVGQLLQRHKAQVTRFARFEVGEGLEKEQTDFAAEVMAQATKAQNYVNGESR